MPNSARKTANRSNQRGSATILFTFVSLLVVLPIVGLAIDGAIVLWQKARLAASVDAAAYAAGRSLSLGSTIPAAQASATATATTYFNANFKPGVLGTTASVVPSVPAPDSTGLWKVSVDATAQVPLYFLRLMGYSTSSLAAHAEVSRRNVNIILVLDRSGSLYFSNSCTPLITAAQSFVNLFVSGQDRLGLVTFQTTANLDFPPTLNFKTAATTIPGVVGMSQLIGKLRCYGYTNTEAALKLAYDQITGINQPLALNVIVFFSDGRPDAVSGTFSVKSSPDTRYKVAPPSTSWTAPASSCTGGAMNGILVSLDDDETHTTASTLGVLPTPSSATGGDPINSNPSNYGLTPSPISSSAAPNCSFSTTSVTQVSGSYSGGAFNVRNDVSILPDNDNDGNSLNTTYHPLTNANSGLFATGVYAGKARPDTPAAIVKAAFNTAYEEVNKIRSGSFQPSPIIYSIGLSTSVDDNFMKDVANDPSAPNYSSSSPQGKYIYAPTSSQLSSAFQQIASQILRISQ